MKTDDNELGDDNDDNDNDVGSVMTTSKKPNKEVIPVMTSRRRKRPAHSQPKLTEAREVSIMVMVTSQMSFPVTETMAVSHSAGEARQSRLMACLEWATPRSAKERRQERTIQTMCAATRTQQSRTRLCWNLL